jgi:hypothetical protein
MATYKRHTKYPRGFLRLNDALKDEGGAKAYLYAAVHRGLTYREIADLLSTDAPGVRICASTVGFFLNILWAEDAGADVAHITKYEDLSMLYSKR